MGGRVATHPLDVSDYTSQVNRRDTIFHDISEAVIPLETGFLKSRTSSFTSNNNDKLLGKSLDLIKEQKENVIVQLAYY